MKRSRLFTAVSCAAASLYLACAPAAPAQVVNGGFESGDLSPWMVTDSSNFTELGSDSAFAHTGSYYVALGATGVLGSLSQVLVTSPGTMYSISFWLANDGGAPPNEFDVFWNGASVFSSMNSPNSGYISFSFNNLLAAGPATTLEFRYRNDADFFRLDDISATVVPESSTLSLALLGFALGGFAWQRKSRRQRVSVTR